MIKSIFNFKIQYLDGSIVDLDDRNLWVESFRIFSPSPEHTTETIDGKHGAIHLGTRLNPRKIVSVIQIEAVDYTDFDLFRDEIFKIFNPLKEFYIVRDLQPGKRMKVAVSSEFDIDYTTLEDGEFTIEFVIHSVFIESVGTTLDPFTFDSEKWQIGQGLLADDLNYIHNTTSFRIFNAGDIDINPRNMPLKITYKGVSNGLVIKNLTTNEAWSYTGASNASDSLVLDGLRSTKNGLSVYRETNKKVITLKPGWNDFILEGTSGSFEISFDFRFYYL